MQSVTRRSALGTSGLLLAGATFAKPALALGAKSWIPTAQKEALIKDAMKEFAVPGVGIAIIEDGEVAWEGSYGVSNIETGAPINDSTLFQAASLTKPLFAYAVFKMIEYGHLGLDDRLADYFRPHDYVSTNWNAQITVRHVLSHKTGLPNWRRSDDPSASLETRFEPGTRYTYSGEAMHWLQQVCEAITGRGLHDLMHRFVFAPAGLSDMAMTWLPGRDAREVYGHDVNDNGEPQLADLQYAREQGWRLQEVAERWGRPLTSWRSIDLDAAHAVMHPHTHPRLADRPLWRLNRPGAALIDSASSLRCTPRDYARFVALLLPQSQTSSIQLSREARGKMLTVATSPGPDGPNRPASYGWSLEPRPSGVAYDHWGFNEGKYISMALGDTSNQKGIVIMTNGAKGNRLMDKVGPVLTGFDYRTFF
ncbi:MAG: serine hydrolase domain-containing protein [Pseudomonadota bacterium]